MCSKMLKIGLHFYIFSVQILIFNITLRMVFYLNTLAKDNMAHKTIFKYMKCFAFYHPELLFPSPWFCFQENTKINFGKKQTRSIPASQTLKYKLHITFRNKITTFIFSLFQIFIIYAGLNFTHCTFRTGEFPI